MEVTDGRAVNALQIALVILVAMGLGLSLYLWVVVNGSRFIPLYADRWKKLEELYRGQILLLAFVVASFGFEDDAPRLVLRLVAMTTFNIFCIHLYFGKSLTATARRSAYTLPNLDLVPGRKSAPARRSPCPPSPRANGRRSVR